MDKISKFLRMLSGRERAAIRKVMGDISSLNLSAHDVKAMTGYRGFYRLRKGKIRILFCKQAGKGFIIDVSYRKDAYKKI